jgi:proton glutamate symport protein
MGKLSLGYQVLWAVILGIAAGIFFGPLTLFLKPLGEVYTMLLQMSVLPYITFSLIHGLGSLTPQTGKRFFKNAWPYLLALWSFIMLIIFLLIQLIPQAKSPVINTASSNEFESNFSKNFLSYLVPENPLYAFSHNIVPAVAIFGLIGGIALMHIQKKDPLVAVIERINQTIETILNWLGQLAPVGAFVYISIVFGTIRLEDLDKIRLFVIALITTTLLVTFWFLPLLISSLTPLKYKDTIKAFRYVCLVPFITGLSTTALPFLNNYLKQFAFKHETSSQLRETSQTILPIAYSFANIGNAMILFFIIFLGYYYRHPISQLDQTMLAVLTIPLSLGASVTSLNSVMFLIQQLGFPASAADFFLEIKSITGNFQVMMSIASVLTLIILSLYTYYGLLEIKWKKLYMHIGSFFAFFIAAIFLSKSVLHFEDIYENLYQNLKITDIIANPVKATILSSSEESSPREFPDSKIPALLKQIATYKVLKVGFNAESIPFCYFNNEKELVGFDIAYAYQLASDLGCSIEFIPFQFDTIAEQLYQGDFDIGMSSIIMTEKRILNMEFPYPYYENNNALIVPRSRKKEFLNLKELQNKKNLKLGAGGAQVEIARKHFPNAEVFSVLAKEELLEDRFARFVWTEALTKKEIDGVLWSETNAIIWCLSHPQFVAISYGDKLGTNYFGYPVRKHATDFGFFLNNWLALKEQSGFHKAMQSYWIDGIAPGGKPPRWSIIRNVLHWID